VVKKQNMYFTRFIKKVFLQKNMKQVNPKLRTSKKEIKDLLIAWIVISVAFGIVLRTTQAIFTIQTGYSIIIAALTVGTGFLLHELAHKVLAQKYRCWAEFRANYGMLFFAIIMSFFGFVFAAPGAVMIFGQVTRRQNGIISIAGPLTNIGLAIVFLILKITLPSTGLLTQLFSTGFYVNAFLALFNMIPVSVFDGKKVYAWNKTYFFFTIGAALVLFFSSFFV